MLLDSYRWVRISICADRLATSDSRSDTVGLFGYLDCFIREIVPLIDQLQLGHLVLPVSSGGTMEGLALGNYLTGNRLRIHAFAVSDNRAYFKSHFQQILDQLELSDLAPLLENDSLVDICDEYVGLGYGRMNDEQFDFLRTLIGKSGILFDPVYTGKCLWGLHEELRNGRFAGEGKNILVLHTGGLLGLMNPEYGKQWLSSSQRHSHARIRNWKTL
jgi:D-cysteine desulfhydrase